MAFQLNSARVLLTWPKSDQLTFKIIKNHLKEIGPIKYAVISKEKHQDQTDHFHAAVLFERKIRKQGNVFTICECVCNVQRIGKSNMSLKRSITYVKKDGDYIEIGELPECLKKLDKKEKVDFILTHNNQECLHSGYFNFSELSKLEMIRSLAIPRWPAFKKRKVWWFWGPTGSGKTRTAMDIASKAYEECDIWVSAGKLEPFFLGYNGQRCAILDDFRPGCLRFESLLRILDGYPTMVNIKFGQCVWAADLIIITAPTQPSDMYVNRETGQEWDNLDQLKRRIDETRQFDHYIDDETEFTPADPADFLSD